MRRITVDLLLFLVLMALAIGTAGQSPSRQELLTQMTDKRAELQKLEEQFLAPSEKDRARFADFLKQPDTGLIRLLPREVFDESPKKASPLTVRGGGAYYSFSRLTHEYGYGSDIELQQNYLSVGFAGADYGMMFNLGDVNLDDLTLENPDVQRMAAYVVPSAVREARAEAMRLGQPAAIEGGDGFRSRLPVKVGTTYILRSFDFGRSDVLVAFHVVRKDSDGSVIIAWKLLKKFPKPELARTENN